MALSYAPNGLQPTAMRGGKRVTGATNRYRIAPGGNTNSIFKGDPVNLTTGGYISQSSVSTDYPIGVFMGCVYNDPTTKRPTWSMYYPANLSVGTDPFGIQAIVVDDVDALMVIQADASISVGDVGYNFSVSASNGSTVTGNSAFSLKAADRSSLPHMVRLVDIYETPDNAFSDANPKVIVQWVQHADNRLSAA